MGFFYIVHIVICVLVIATVLFQDGKTGGLVSVADSSHSVFGAKGASSFLTKLTAGLSIVFLFLSFALAKQSAPSTKSIASDHAPVTQESPGGLTPAEPATGGGALEKDEVGVSGDSADQVKGAEIIRDSDQVPEEIKEGIKKSEEREAQKEKEQEKKDGQDETQDQPEEKKDDGGTN